MSVNFIVETNNDIAELFSSSKLVQKIKAKFSPKPTGSSNPKRLYSPKISNQINIITEKPEPLERYNIQLIFSDSTHELNTLCPGISNDLLLGKLYRLSCSKLDIFTLTNYFADWVYQKQKIIDPNTSYPDLLQKIKPIISRYLPLLRRNKLQVKMTLKPEFNASNEGKIPDLATKLCAACNTVSEDVEIYCPNCGTQYGF